MPARPPLRGARPLTWPGRALVLGTLSLACVSLLIPAAASAAPAMSAASAGPASATRPATMTGYAARTNPVPPWRYNVSRTHSPTALRMLAGQAGQAGQAGAIQPSITPPSGDVRGVDVASFQHAGGQPIGWGKVAGAGFKFAFIKATEGTYYVNPYYAGDLAAARAAGMQVAGYHFAIPNNSSGTLQADFALNAENYPANGQTLPFILDAEYDPYTRYDHTNQCYGLSPAQMVSWISAFTAEIRRRTGQPTIIYTPPKWWDTCTGNSTAFGADPLWDAYYPPPNSSVSAPVLPAGWSKWAFWQYTSAGTVPGIPGTATDLSFFNPATLSVPAPGTQSSTTGRPVRLSIASLNAAAGQTMIYSATGLPPGLTISTSGVITGTLPRVPRSYRPAVTARGPAGSVSLAFTWHVHGPARLDWPGRQSTPAGGPASLQIRSSDGLPGCTLQFSATGLPPALSISPCGQVTGWASQPGEYMVHVHAADSSGRTVGAVSFAWTITMPAPGAAGRIRVAVGRLCLASVSRVTVSVQTCWHSGGQIWDYVQNGTIRLNGRCLTAQGSTTVGFATCDRTAGQEWQYQPGGSLVNGGTGQCLADASAGTRPAPVVQAACDGAAGQTWTLPPGPLFAGLPGSCLAAVRPRTGRLLHLVVTRCARTADQSWTIGPSGTLSVLGHCLTAQTPLRPGAAATLSACGGTAAQRDRQQWQPLTENGYSFLVEPLTGLCLGDLLHGSALSAVGLRHCTAGYPRLGWAIS
ncbi:MAG: GH25 family lysozyme [Streptosporangiaceae bacterium]